MRQVMIGLSGGTLYSHRTEPMSVVTTSVKLRGNINGCVPCYVHKQQGPTRLTCPLRKPGASELSELCCGLPARPRDSGFSRGRVGALRSQAPARDTQFTTFSRASLE